MGSYRKFRNWEILLLRIEKSQARYENVDYYEVTECDSVRRLLCVVLLNRCIPSLNAHSWSPHSPRWTSEKTCARSSFTALFAVPSASVCSAPLLHYLLSLLFLLFTLHLHALSHIHSIFYIAICKPFFLIASFVDSIILVFVFRCLNDFSEPYLLYRIGRKMRRKPNKADSNERSCILWMSESVCE